MPVSPIYLEASHHQGPADRHARECFPGAAATESRLGPSRPPAMPPILFKANDRRLRFGAVAAPAGPVVPGV